MSSSLSPALQFEMLCAAGLDTDDTVRGLAAISLINVAALLALPLLARPAMLAGIAAGQPGGDRQHIKPASSRIPDLRLRAGLRRAVTEDAGLRIRPPQIKES